MTDSIRAQTRALLDDALRSFRGTSEYDALAALAATLDAPLRVAIAGRVKAGKSTLLNALVGERVAATDAGECTRVVTWYENGVAPIAWAYPQGGGERFQLPYVRADGHTVIDLAASGVHADDLERLVVAFPSRRLERVTLIDTPGIASLSTAVSQRTIEFLDSDHAAQGGADAVLYLMRHLHESDVDFLEAFHDAEFAGTMPVNAIGVLSRADEIGAGRTDSLDLARRISLRYRGDDRIRALVQTVVPVAALIAEGAITMRQTDFDSLKALSELPLETVDRLLLTADEFVSGSAPPTLPAPTRAELLERFGLFGVRLSVTLLQHGITRDAATLSRELHARSGLPELRSVLESQFTDRAAALKAVAVLHAVDRALAAHPVPNTAEIRSRQERLRMSGHELAEIKLLNDLRTGTTRFDGALRDEVETLLGAAGGSIRERLGLPDDASIDDTRTALLARLEQWQRRAESPAADRELVRVAGLICRTCEGLMLDPELQTASTH